MSGESVNKRKTRLSLCLALTPKSQNNFCFVIHLFKKTKAIPPSGLWKATLTRSMNPESWIRPMRSDPGGMNLKARQCSFI